MPKPTDASKEVATEQPNVDFGVLYKLKRFAELPIITGAIVSLCGLITLTFTGFDLMYVLSGISLFFMGVFVGIKITYVALIKKGKETSS